MSQPTPEVALVFANPVEKLAKDLLRIAKVAMPDSYYATDRRCQHARQVLRSIGRLPKSEQRHLEK